MDDTLTYRELPGQGFLDKMLHLNSINEYLIWATGMVVAIVIARIVRSFIKTRMKKSGSKFSSFYLKLESKLFPFIYLFIIFATYHGSIRQPGCLPSEVSLLR